MESKLFLDFTINLIFLLEPFGIVNQYLDGKCWSLWDWHSRCWWAQGCQIADPIAVGSNLSQDQYNIYQWNCPFHNIVYLAHTLQAGEHMEGYLRWKPSFEGTVRTFSKWRLHLFLHSWNGRLKVLLPHLVPQLILDGFLICQWLITIQNFTLFWPNCPRIELYCCWGKAKSRRGDLLASGWKYLAFLYGWVEGPRQCTIHRMF